MVAVEGAATIPGDNKGGVTEKERQGRRYGERVKDHETAGARDG